MRRAPRPRARSSASAPVALAGRRERLAGERARLRRLEHRAGPLGRGGRGQRALGGRAGSPASRATAAAARRAQAAPSAGPWPRPSPRRARASARGLVALARAPGGSARAPRSPSPPAARDRRQLLAARPRTSTSPRAPVAGLQQRRGQRERRPCRDEALVELPRRARRLSSAHASAVSTSPAASAATNVDERPASACGMPASARRLERAVEQPGGLGQPAGMTTPSRASARASATSGPSPAPPRARGSACAAASS